LSRLKTGAGMRAVAERLVRRPAAAAQRERPLRNLIRVPVPIDERHVVAFDQIRAVHPHFDTRHGHPIFCIDERISAFVFVFDILSSRSSMASTADSGLRTLRRTQMRLRSSRGMSNSSLRVPLFCTSIDGNTRLSVSLRSRWISMLPVPL